MIEIRYPNRCKDLFSLLLSFFTRKDEEEKSRRRMNPYVYGYGTYPNNFQRMGMQNDDRVVYFYEWSDLDRVPIKFPSCEEFEVYAHRCGITVLPYQRDLIKNLRESHIVCKKNSKCLLIRMSRDLLKESFEAQQSLGEFGNYTIM